jgi:hypothetical protein
MGRPPQKIAAARPAASPITASARYRAVPLFFSFQHFSFSHCCLAIPLTFTPASATLLAMSSSFQTGSGISALLGPLPAKKRFLVNP